jgi:TniQ
VMREADSTRRLPVLLKPVADELLSSWISRHAAFYGVPPLVMLRHCLPEASSVRAADLHLTAEQTARVASVFATESETVQQMTLVDVAPASRRFVATKPLQHCPNCNTDKPSPAPIMRSQLQGWRITCAICRGPLRGNDDHETPSPFRQYWAAALHGEELIDAESERRIRSWASPADIARLLLMRRVLTYSI